MGDRIAAREGRLECEPVRAVEDLEPETRRIETVSEIRNGAVREIVHSDDLESFVQQPLAQVRADEARPAGDEHCLIRQSASLERTRVPSEHRRGRHELAHALRGQSDRIGSQVHPLHDAPL